MIEWWVLYKKEMTEMWRNYQWLWVPLVFIMIAVMQPLSIYYMPQILKMGGNMPAGTVIEIPTPSGREVMAQVFSQYNTMGTLILVLVFMGIVSAERQNGTAVWTLVKPVSFMTYLMSKWTSMLTLASVSLAVSYGAAWYYTELLLSHADAQAVLIGLGSFALWMMLIMTITLFMSSLLKSPGAAAFLTLFTTVALSALTSLLPKFFTWSPVWTYRNAVSYMDKGTMAKWWGVPIAVDFALVAALLITASIIYRRKEWQE